MPGMSPAPHSPAILDIHQLHFAHAGEPALAAGWSARIGPGVTLLQGDTGSGKSTLLRLLAGQLPGTPAMGQRTLGGVDFDADPAAYRRQLFLCDLATNAFDQMSGRECAAAWSADDPGFRADEWQALVEGFSLTEHLEKKLFMLSTGSRRKVWLAYALASGRPLVLLDEPTGGLDAPSTRCLWAALNRVAASGQRAVVVASTEGLDQVPLAGTITLPLGS